MTGSASTGGVFTPGTPDRILWAGPYNRPVNSSTTTASCTTVSFSVLYPSDFVPTSVTNTAQATYTPAGASQKTIEGSVTHGFVTGTAGGTFSKSNTGTIANTYPIDQQPGFDWRISLANTGSVAQQNVVVEDAIPAQALVNQISVGRFIPYYSLSVQYQLKDNGTTWYDLPGNPYTAPADVAITSLDPAPTDANPVTRVRWNHGTIPPGYQRFDNNASSYHRVRVTFRNPDRNGNPVAVPTAVQNVATYSATNLTLTNATNTVTTSAGLPVAPRMDKSGDTSSFPTGQNFTPGTQTTYTLTLTNNSSTNGPDLRNAVILDALPATTQYLSHTVAYGTGVTPPAPADAPVFAQYPNPTGSGTVLRWTWPNLAIPAATSGPPATPARAITVNITVRVLSGASGLPGQYTNLGMLAGLSNGDVVTTNCRLQPAPVDTNDLDQDGNRTETLCVSRNALYNILPNASLNSVKLVKGACAGNTDYASTATTYGNGPLSYRLTVSNPGNVSVNRAIFYDIFPYAGDRGVISVDARGSDWAPALTGAVSVPSGATVEYSQSTNPCRPELFGGTAGQALPSGCTNDWTGIAPTDITSVKALKVSFGTNITIAPEDALRFSWPMRAPVSAQIAELGNNSFGYLATRTDGLTPALQAAEPNLVQTTIDCSEAPPFIGDYVWHDTNRNGIQDTGEVGINGVVVELWSPGADGQAGGIDDTLVSATLSAADGAGHNGFYRFGDLLPGSYYVRFTPPAGYSISPQEQGSDPEKDSDPDPLTGETAVLTVALGGGRLDIDMGLVEATTATVGNYVWIDRNGNGVQDESPSDGLNGVPVDLLGDGGQVVRSTVTADDSFGNPGYYLFRDVSPGTYSLQVDRRGTFASGFTTANAGTGSNDSRIAVDAAGLGTGALFSLVAGSVVLNQDAGLVFPAGPLSVGDRIWLDLNNNGIYEPATESGIDGVTLYLYADTNGDNLYTPGADRFVASTTSFTKTGFPGFYEFTGLPAGSYVLQVIPANFATGGALADTIPSTGSGSPPPDPDNDLNDNLDQNAYTDAQGTVATKAITLSVGGEPSGDHNPTLDAGFVTFDTLVAIGNLVFYDVNANGRFDPSLGDTGVDGVAVKLFQQGQNPLTATPARTTLTSGGGFYLFDLVPQGNWFVYVPKEEFGTGGHLAAMASSPGNGGDNAYDDNLDENGQDGGTPTTQGVSTHVFALAFGTEPTGEVGAGAHDYPGLLPDDSVNLTADLGFLDTCTTICDVNSSGRVDVIDLNLIGARRGTRVSPPGRAYSGDCNRDGVLSINDQRACLPFKTP